MPKYANVLFVLVLVLGENNRVSTSESYLGYTYPTGDITLEYGEPLIITCVLSDTILGKYGYEAVLDLHFVRNIDDVPNDLLKVINATSIRLHIDRPNPVIEDDYGCYYQDLHKIVGRNVVSVGVKPQNVTDFSCIVHNYEKLTCNWTAPNNFVKTSYNLDFKIPGGRFRCPSLNKNGSTRSCVWSMSTFPQYKPAHAILNFTLLMVNQFGNNTLNYVFNSPRYAIPDAPQNLVTIPTSPHSILLSWQVPGSMNIFSSGVHHRVLYKCEYYPNQWHLGGLITNQLENRNVSFELTNLKYAHTLCDIRVSLRSAMADPNNDFAWSDNATGTVRTLSKIPDEPPLTNIGSFIIEPIGSQRNIIVFWKLIKEEFRNGENFQYKVEVENTGITKYSSKAFIELKDLASKEYKINIWSQNDEGLSLEKSTMVVPERPLLEPRRFIKIAHPDSFELIWDPSKSKITHYTIFWCRTETDWDYCSGYLDWVIVPSHATQYILNLPRNVNYHISISANDHNSSSGMLLAACTIVPGKHVTQLRSVWIRSSGSDFIEVHWYIDCWDYITSAQGFIIYYCQSEKGQSDCVEEMKSVTTGNDERSGIIENLTPNTTYRITVAVILSDTAISQPSDPVFYTTH